MRMCLQHWNNLRAGVMLRGMSHLVTESAEEVLQNIQDEMAGEPARFDPLLKAHMNICTRAIEMGGIYLLSLKADGSHYCPLCELATHSGEQWPQQWIDGALDAEKAEAIRLGLTKETLQ